MERFYKNNLCPKFNHSDKHSYTDSGVNPSKAPATMVAVSSGVLAQGDLDTRQPPEPLPPIYTFVWAWTKYSTVVTINLMPV